ncbi:hypothetical protein T484DRAFT_1901378 [Baffinella frigidus]|nr:hypothetical protein T484DRAFT_1901378 [Cryptophyta sp. CCMP2293]
MVLADLYLGRILDPEDAGVEKRFLVVRSSHGLSNTQIEEVTGLLVAVVTRRALILDFSNDSYTGQRPVMEYDWPIDIWVDGMSPFLDPPTEGGDAPEVVDAPRIPNEEYGKYGELLACLDWNASMVEPFVVFNTFFGFPTAYLNSQHAQFIREHFGSFAFPILHAFLHRPGASVRSVAGGLHQEHLANASCSVGLQIRWHHLRAYLDLTEKEHPEAAVAKFLRCAASLCPLHSPSTVIFVATDFRYIHEVVTKVAETEARRLASEASPNFARTCRSATFGESVTFGDPATLGDPEACPTRQSSTSFGGVAARANDGDTSGEFPSGKSCTHTWDDDGMSGLGTADPWWEVDLQHVREVAGVKLYNRADCCGDRLTNVTIRVGDRGAPDHGENAVCARGVDVSLGDSFLAICAGGPFRGRYVTVQRPGPNKILTICEAEVVGESAETAALRERRFAKVVHLEARREVVNGDVIMDGGDHETAVADQLLLASCDHIVTTKESTLGYVAHASVLKPTFQVSTHDAECVAVPHSQSGLVQDDERIHDEWPWSRGKFRKLSCAAGFEGLLERHAGDVLAPV